MDRLILWIKRTGDSHGQYRAPSGNREVKKPGEQARRKPESSQKPFEIQIIPQAGLIREFTSKNTANSFRWDYAENDSL
jgi:hypothetical protein